MIVTCCIAIVAHDRHVTLSTLVSPFQVNIQGIQNVAKLCWSHDLRIFCPSTIGAFRLSSLKVAPEWCLKSAHGAARRGMPNCAGLLELRSICAEPGSLLSSPSLPPSLFLSLSPSLPPSLTSTTITSVKLTSAPCIIMV